MYKIRCKTKRGGSSMQFVSIKEQAMAKLLTLFKQRLAATIEKNGVIIGEVYKMDGRWNWYMDTEA